MARRATKPAFFPRMIGHTFGVLGAMMGVNAIVTSINPRFLQLFPFDASGIQQASAGLMSIGFIALGMWLVWEKAIPQRKKPDSTDL